MKKRMMLHAVLALILVGTMLLAGCSGANGSNSSSSGAGENPSNVAEKTKEKETPEVRGKISVSLYDRGSIPAEEGTMDNNRWTRWLGENGPANLKFVTVPRWESKEKFNVLFASASAPDLIFEYDTGYRNELINQKQLMPLNDLIEEHSVEYKAMLEKYPILKKVATREDGNMYEFGRLNGLVTNHALYVRQDWLDNLGLSIPKTVDEFYTVAEAFVKQDPDRNGKNDTLAIGVTGAAGAVLNGMFQNVGYKVQDGTLVRTWENAVASNEFVKKLYDNGLIDKDFLTDNKGEKANQDFISGKLGFFGANGGASSPGYRVFEALKKNFPNAKVVAMELPASQFGQFSPVINNPAQATASVNANAKDPVAIMKYVDFLVRESTTHTLNFGLEGEHYQLGDNGCPKLIDSEKNKKELDWNGDLRMLVSPALFGPCGHFSNQLDLNNPIDQEFMEIIKQAEAAYLNPVRPMADYTHVEYMPSLPKDLQLIVTNTNEQLASFYQKALIGGAKYSVEQASKDAQAFWEKAGGKQVEQWYADWYKNSSKNAILAKDMYEIKID